MSWDLDISEATRLLDTIEQVLSPGAIGDTLLYAADIVGHAALELMPGASTGTPYPPQTNNPLPLYYERMSAPVYRYRTVNGVRQKTDEILVPSQPYKSKFKSAKQQAFVIMQARRGLIPYRRTGTLGKSFTSSKPILISSNIAEVSVGTNLDYAPYVVGRGIQSHYHQGNWPILEDALAEGAQTLQNTAMIAIVSYIRRRIRNER